MTGSQNRPFMTEGYHWLQILTEKEVNFSVLHNATTSTCGLLLMHQAV